MSDLRMLNEQLRTIFAKAGFSKQAREVKREQIIHAAKQLPSDNIASGEYSDLCWQFCEKLADEISDQQPELAGRLYFFAEESFIREGMQASGSGEGLISQRDVKRVREKRIKCGID